MTQTVLQKPRACPSCGSGNIKQIIYGYPPPQDIMERAKRHDVVLGGNVFEDTMPDWICFRCNHRWFDPSDPGRAQRAEEWRQQELARERARPVLPPKTLFDDPVSFGFKNTWWAVPASDTDAVVSAFRIQNPEPCNWTNGIARAYQDSVFVTPPINNWTLIVGCGNPIDQNARQRVVEPLRQLSSRFGVACVFSTHRIVEYHVWAKAVSGSLVRGFGYVGESDITFWNEGPMTPEEMQLGFGTFDSRGPSELSVMDIARAWSISPYDLDGLKPVCRELGVLGSDALLFECVP